MSPPARLSLAAPRGHALAEAVRLAFEARGSDLDLVPVQAAGLWASESPIRLTLRRGAEAAVILRDPIAMLDLAEDLHPDRPLHPRDPVRRAEHREAMAALPKLAAILDRLTHSKDPRDVDLNTHLARGQIARIAPLLATTSDVTLLGIAATPLLWRIDALDRAYESHLLTGLPFGAYRHPDPSAVLDARLLAELLAAVVSQGGLIARTEARPDWSRALGPAGNPRVRENDIPSTGQRTEVRSIGSPTRSR